MERRIEHESMHLGADLRAGKPREGFGEKWRAEADETENYTYAIALQK